MSLTNYDLNIQQGATKIFEVNYKTVDESGNETAFDLTDYLGRGQIRYKPNDENYLAEFIVEISDTPTDGHITITLPSTALESIEFKGRNYKEMTNAVYDIELYKEVDGNDVYVIRILQGICYISPEVTK